MENREPEIKEANPRLTSQTGGLTYSLAAVCFLASALIFNLIMGSVPKYGYAYWYLNFIAAPVAIGVCVVSVLAVRKIPFKQVFPVKCKPKYYLIALLLVFGMFFSLNRINELFINLIGKEQSESSVALTAFLSGLRGGHLVLALLVIAVLPALFEETLFRGVILNSCEGDAGSLATIFIVGLCFSLFHGSPEQTVYQFIAGCLFAFVAVRSGSILPGIMMHFINNALAVILPACGLCDELGNLAVPFSVSVTLTVLGCCALAGGVVWLVLDKKPLKKSNKDGVKNFFIYGAVGLIVCAALWISSLIGG